MSFYKGLGCAVISLGLLITTGCLVGGSSEDVLSTRLEITGDTLVMAPTTPRFR